MKTTNIRTKTNQAFTLIEMIGVLAVIAILAALLIPKVFAAITEAKINTVPVGCATVKTAVIDHYAKYGSLNSLKGTSFTNTPYYRFDTDVLLAEGFIDKPFAPRVGSTNNVVLIEAVAGSTTVAANEGQTYNLSGAGTTNEATGSHVVFAEIGGVPIADAQAISSRIDGLTMSAAEGSATNDLSGRVKYAAGTTTTVYIYLTHR